MFYFAVDSSSGQNASLESTAFISPGVWYHVAAVRGSNFIQLYVNGVLQGQASVAFPQDYGSFPLYFGTAGQSYWNGMFKGLLDEVSLYGAVLSPEDIGGIYQAGSGGKCKTRRGMSPGVVVGWGADSAGQSDAPPGLTNVVATAAGGYFSLALLISGTVIGWGDDSYGQIDVPTGLSNVVAIAAGSFFSLALQDNGTAVVWGANLYGQANVPPGLSNVVAIAAGDKHSLALMRNGSVVGWGLDSAGQAVAPPGLTNVEAIGGGVNCSLALQGNGTVVAWGDNSAGQTSVPPGLSNVIAIATSAYHSLALLSNGTVVAWGDGQTKVPPGLSNVVAIAAGVYDSLALQSNGTVAVWGDNSLGGTNVPAGLSNVVALGTDSLAYHSLATTLNPWIFPTLPASVAFPLGAATNLSVGVSSSTPFACQWFFNGQGIAGATGTTLPITNFTPDNAGAYWIIVTNQYATAIATTFVSLTNSPAYPLTFTTLGGGSISLWPPPYSGSSPVVTYPSNTVVTLTATPSNNLSFVTWTGDSTQTTNVINIVMNQPHSVQALFGGVLNLLTNGNGQVLINPPSGPYLFRSLVQLTALPLPGSYFAGWAGAASGLANPLTLTMTNSPAITAVFAPLSANQVALTTLANGPGTVTINPLQNPYTNGEIVTLTARPAFGYFFNGWTGDVSGTLNPMSITLNTSMVVTANFSLLARGVAVGWGNDAYGQTDVPPGLTNVVAVAAGEYHSLALLGDGTVVGWGLDWAGQTDVPAELGSVVEIAAGAAVSLALKSDGTVVAWGDNSEGQSTVPSGLSGVVGIACGFQHCLALRPDGTVVGWGNNNFGQLSVPAGLSNVVAVAAGQFHSLAQQNDGTIVGWGNNTNGEVYIPPGLDDVALIAAGGFHNLALLGNGTVVAWGDNLDSETNVPADLGNVISVAAGAYHSLALQNNGAVSAWGDNAYGETSLPLGLSNVTAIGSGPAALHSLAVTLNPIIVPSLAVSVALPLGGATNLSVGVSSSTPFACQWFFNGQGIAGATGTTLPITNFTPDNAGAYWIIVTNQYATAMAATIVSLTNSPTYPLTFTTPGGGSISLWPPPYSGTSSVVTYPSNTVVTLTATPSNNLSFVTWTGDSTQTTNVINIVMNQPHSVQALFGGVLNLLTNGNGQVLIDPPSGPYLFGSTVQLTALPLPGSFFSGWAGAASGVTDPVRLTITNSPTLTALFAPLTTNQVALTTSANGPGTVTVNPQSPYTNGQTVTLTAFPIQDYALSSWSGDISGVSNPMSLTLNTSLVVTANFSLLGPGATLYVSLQGTNPVGPYATWYTAATNIQDAIDWAQPGDIVLVTNGTYSAASVVLRYAANCVALTKPITVESVNGAQATTLLGSSGTRCAYVGSGAELNGFTLLNGRVPGDPGMQGSVSGAAGAFCATNAVLANCIIASNVGIVVYGGILTNCWINSNSGPLASGYCSIESATLYNCLITSNYVIDTQGYSGATYNCTNYSCTYAENNYGSLGDTLYNCLLTNNTVGAVLSAVVGCTVVNNAMGTWCCSCTNSIIYFNYGTGTNSWGGLAATNSNWMPALPYHRQAGSFDHCCTTPLPAGPGNTAKTPMFVDPAHGVFRLACGSPCIDAGANYSFMPTNDIRGFPRPVDGTGSGIAAFDIGAYEYNPALDTGPHILINFPNWSPTNLFANVPVSFSSQIDGCPSWLWWDFGDGTVVSNQAAPSHTWTSPGLYNVQLTGYFPLVNATLTATTQVQVVVRPVYYVNASNSTPVFPYTNWATSAMNIQDAIAADTFPGRLVLVADGIYQGGHGVIMGMQARIVTTNPVVVQSVNGPLSTVINGYQVNAGCYVGNNALLAGFTVTNVTSSGGIFCQPGGVISNCWITGNHKGGERWRG
ncbi:hypothetical protein SBV1_1120016 [Verrucomicrobia bacterium]|nr:hypothetical protein SBV1_1120016 [Verrucomicrobiota bacterium]